MNILHHPAARLAAFASGVTAPVASVLRRRPVVLTDETPPAVITDRGDDWPVPLAGLDVDALVANGELGYIDTASRAELTARGLLGVGQHPTIAASAARAADLAAELERRRAATVDALTDVLTIENRAVQARAAFLADLDALGRAA